MGKSTCGEYNSKGILTKGIKIFDGKTLEGDFDSNGILIKGTKTYPDGRIIQKN